MPQIDHDAIELNPLEESAPQLFIASWTLAGLPPGGAPRPCRPIRDGGEPDFLVLILAQELHAECSLLRTTIGNRNFGVVSAS